VRSIQEIEAAVQKLSSAHQAIDAPGPGAALAWLLTALGQAWTTGSRPRLGPPNVAESARPGGGIMLVEQQVARAAA
jgi:hypothetical protein